MNSLLQSRGREDAHVSTVRPLPTRGWVTHLGGGYAVATPSLTVLQPSGLEYNGLFNSPPLSCYPVTRYVWSLLYELMRVITIHCTV